MNEQHPGPDEREPHPDEDTAEIPLPSVVADPQPHAQSDEGQTANALHGVLSDTDTGGPPSLPDEDRTTVLPPTAPPPRGDRRRGRPHGRRPRRWWLHRGGSRRRRGTDPDILAAPTTQNTPTPSGSAAPDSGAPDGNKDVRDNQAAPQYWAGTPNPGAAGEDPTNGGPQPPTGSAEPPEPKPSATSGSGTANPATQPSDDDLGPAEVDKSAQRAETTADTSESPPETPGATSDSGSGHEKNRQPAPEPPDHPTSTREKASEPTSAADAEGAPGWVHDAVDNTDVACDAGPENMDCEAKRRIAHRFLSEP